MAEQAVDVAVHFGGEEITAGRLWSHRRRGSESATFAYTDEYLSSPSAYALDPVLPLVAGQQQTAAGRAMFGAFTDCAPDRWGRRLIQRSERQRVRRDGGAERSFGEIDYLLGVRDDLRQGALRFHDPEGGVYYAPAETGVPQLIELPRLLGAASKLERDEASEDEIRLLLQGGSSLGGARPKAHVLDSGERIAIAKFPSVTTDEWDVIRWEAVALKLARAGGVEVADWQVVEIGENAVLVVDRFDRSDGSRIGYVSAMTMLEATDGDRGSYLDIVDVIETNSPAATRDLKQLWRRIAFSILISNTDDHLRNHGFIRATSAGWSLSPAFDLNPDPQPGPKLLNTAIDFDNNEARIDLLMEVSEHFRLTERDAMDTLGEVVSPTMRWRETAATMGLSGAAIEDLAPAFEHEQATLAREMTRATA
jgi:serine/threonine-protein kinase HipA